MNETVFGWLLWYFGSQWTKWIMLNSLFAVYYKNIRRMKWRGNYVTGKFDYLTRILKIENSRFFDDGMGVLEWGGWRLQHKFGRKACWKTSACKEKDKKGVMSTLYLLTWIIWWALNNATKWQMGFNWVFKGLR